MKLSISNLFYIIILFICLDTSFNSGRTCKSSKKSRNSLKSNSPLPSLSNFWKMNEEKRKWGRGKTLQEKRRRYLELFLCNALFQDNVEQVQKLLNFTETKTSGVILVRLLPLNKNITRNNQSKLHENWWGVSSQTP